jgi:hypothetical protein
MPHLHEVPLVEITRAEWEKTNNGWISTISDDESDDLPF